MPQTKHTVGQLLELHRETCDGCRATMTAKNADYCGGSGDPYANFRITEVFGIHPVMGIMIRVTDKLQRLRAFITNGELAVKTESFTDACDDIVNYAILIKGMLLEEASRESSVETKTEPVDYGNCITCGAKLEYDWLYGVICDNCLTAPDDVVTVNEQSQPKTKAKPKTKNK